MLISHSTAWIRKLLREGPPQGTHTTPEYCYLQRLMDPSIHCFYGSDGQSGVVIILSPESFGRFRESYSMENHDLAGMALLLTEYRLLSRGSGTAPELLVSQFVYMGETSMAVACGSQSRPRGADGERRRRLGSEVSDGSVACKRGVQADMGVADGFTDRYSVDFREIRKIVGFPIYEYLREVFMEEYDRGWADAEKLPEWSDEKYRAWSSDRWAGGRIESEGNCGAERYGGNVEETGSAAESSTGCDGSDGGGLDQKSPARTHETGRFSNRRMMLRRLHAAYGPGNLSTASIPPFL